MTEKYFKKEAGDWVETTKEDHEDRTAPEMPRAVTGISREFQKNRAKQSDQRAALAADRVKWVHYCMTLNKFIVIDPQAENCPMCEKGRYE